MNGGEAPMAFVEIEVKRPDRLVMKTSSERRQT
jgi:hypothetical protein